MKNIGIQLEAERERIVFVFMNFYFQSFGKGETAMVPRENESAEKTVQT